MAQVLPTVQPQERAPQPAPAKVVPIDAQRKGKPMTPESVAVLSLFLG